MARQVLNMTPRKGMPQSVDKEIRRDWDEPRWGKATLYGNYDRSREPLNFQIRRGLVLPTDKSLTIAQHMAEQLQIRGIPDPNAGLWIPKRRTIADFIFSGSPDRMRELAFGNQAVDYENLEADNSHLKRLPDIERWCQDIYAYVAGKWGEENIIGFHCHLDENSPHIHCEVMAINSCGVFSFNEIFAGRNRHEFSLNMKKIHDELAEVNRPWNLQRGVPVMETGARKVTREAYHRQLNQRNNELEVTVATNESIITSQNELVQSLTSRASLMQQQAEEALLARKQSEQLLAKLAEDRKIAEKQLHEISEKLEQAKAQLSLTQTQTATETVKRINALAHRAAFYKISCDLEDFKESLPTELREKLPQISNKEIGLAKLLYVGHQDGVTEFLKNLGITPYPLSFPNRGEHETDTEWMYRCLLEAGGMLKGQGISRNR